MRRIVQQIFLVLRVDLTCREDHNLGKKCIEDKKIPDGKPNFLVLEGIPHFILTQENISQ